MYNLETLTTLGIQQYIRGRQTQNVQSREIDNIGYTTGNMRKTIKNVQCRETDNIGYTTGNMRKTIKNVQSRDTDNIGYTTRYKRKTNTESTIQRN